MLLTDEGGRSSSASLGHFQCLLLENFVFTPDGKLWNTVSSGGRTITNLSFADDIDGLAGEEEELATFFI